MTTRENAARLRAEYPVGTRIRLIRMDDEQAPPAGTEGTVRGVDDIGSIQMSWDTGSSLALIEGTDEFEKIN